MARKFKDCLSFAGFLQSALANAAMKKALGDRAEKAGKMVQENARARLGNYQNGWAPLKDETIARKARGDTPLLETGKMRDSIGYKVDRESDSKVTVQIGSNDPSAVANEIGTARIPPRPFLLPAALEVAPQVGAQMAKDLAEVLGLKGLG